MNKVLKSGETIVHVMIGSNSNVLAEMKAGDFNNIVWASDSLTAVSHHYEGCVIELTVILDQAVAMEYVASPGDLKVPLADYTWGSEVMSCPTAAIWYSFSKSYLKEHLIEVKEIDLDLTNYF